MQRILNLFESKKEILSIFFTAGYPTIDSTLPIIEALEKANVDMIEIGIPFSDPLADGPVVQDAGTVALQNGMRLEVLLEQLRDIRKQCTIPLILMGYLNPILQYDMNKFLAKCKEIGIDGLIIPDLPLSYFQDSYASLFEKFGISFIPLISPETTNSRIVEIASKSSTFIYMVSSSSITGSTNNTNEEQLKYYERIHQMNLPVPQLIGFGIHDRATYNSTLKYQQGGIIGSDFLRFLKEHTLDEIPKYISKFR